MFYIVDTYIAKVYEHLLINIVKYILNKSWLKIIHASYNIKDK